MRFWFSALLICSPLLVLAQAVEFSGPRALKHIQALVDSGPRVMGSPGHEKARGYFKAELKGGDWLSQSWDFQAGSGKSYRLHNLMYRLNRDAPMRVIIGSHYDTRAWADKDQQNPKAAMPGANDGASGVAVILELGRLARQHPLKNIGLDLVFFDGEEGEPEQKRSWYPIGSYRFAQELTHFYPTKKPILALVPDMVCDKDLQLHPDKNSVEAAPWAVKGLWEIGAKLNPGINKEPKYAIYDDHTALNNVGVPSVVMIDFDYAPFHTSQDLPNQCSVQNLADVGQMIWQYLQQLDQSFN